MPKYAKDFDGYKITFSGYKELNVDSVEPVDELIFDL